MESLPHRLGQARFIHAEAIAALRAWEATASASGLFSDKVIAFAAELNCLTALERVIRLEEELGLTRQNKEAHHG